MQDILKKINIRWANLNAIFKDGVVYINQPQLINTDINIAKTTVYGFVNEGKQNYRVNNGLNPMGAFIKIERSTTETPTPTPKKITEHNAVDFPRNIILQGPPGTSKTWLAKRMARVLLGVHYDPSDSLDKLIGKANNLLEDSNDEFLKSEDSDGRFKIIQFHPSLTYEDFVRGLVSDRKGSYEPENKVFGKICAEAKKAGDKIYVIVIDEINRANLPAVLGELIYALEYRDNDVETPYEEPTDDKDPITKNASRSRKITIPSNLFVIGTMNTADRSIGQMDYALRRRFVFIDQLPDTTVVTKTNKEAEGCFKKILGLFVEKSDPINWARRNEKSLSPDFHPRDVAIGHTYFLKDWEFQLRYKVVPVLEEYIKDGVLLNENNKLSEAIEAARGRKAENKMPTDAEFAAALLSGLEQILK